MIENLIGGLFIVGIRGDVAVSASWRIWRQFGEKGDRPFALRGHVTSFL